MSKRPAHIVIPARYASTRFPGKALVDICGTPMVVRVIRQCLETSADSVTLATDDERIFNVARGLCNTPEAKGRFSVVMTSSEHVCGTDRVAEVADKMQWPETDFVVNVQGDEPFIPTQHIEQVVALLKESGDPIVTLCDKIEPGDLHNRNVCKVAVNRMHHAMLYTRALIPCAFRALGIYGFTVSSLKHVTSFKPSQRELEESVEPLRWLDNEVPIAVHLCAFSTPPGVDTLADVQTLTERFTDPVATS